MVTGYNTLEEMAQTLGITKQGAHSRLQAGNIVKIGKQYFFNIELMKALLDAKSHKGIIAKTTGK